jgi:hypothetical protein
LIRSCIRSGEGEQLSRRGDEDHKHAEATRAPLGEYFKAVTARLWQLILSFTSPMSQPDSCHCCEIAASQTTAVVRLQLSSGRMENDEVVREIDVFITEELEL